MSNDNDNVNYNKTISIALQVLSSDVWFKSIWLINCYIHRTIKNYNFAFKDCNIAVKWVKI